MSGKMSLSCAMQLSLWDKNLWTKLQGASADKRIGFFKIKLPGGGPGQSHVKIRPNKFSMLKTL